MNLIFFIRLRKISKLNYIPTEFSKSVDNYATINERKYFLTSNEYEALHEGEPYLALDFHRTLSDTYELLLLTDILMTLVT